MLRRRSTWRNRAALDFHMLGRPRFGVISGCDMTLGSTGGSGLVTVQQGVALVNDAVVAVTSGQVTLPLSSQSPRFDLITVNAGGTIGYIRGDPSANPIYPSYDDTVTVLAAVYITPGNTAPDPSRDITDKRRFVNQRFGTAITGGKLLSSYAPGPPLVEQFSIDAFGATAWSGDTTLSRTAAKTLSVADNLNVAEMLTADSINIAKTLTVSGDMTGGQPAQGARQAWRPWRGVARRAR